MVQAERVTIRLPTSMLAEIDALVDLGEYATRTEVIRNAMRKFFREQGALAGEVIEAKKGMQNLKEMAAEMQAMQAKLNAILSEDL